MATVQPAGVIFGASSGVGHALASKLACRRSIIAVARRMPIINGAVGRSCDVRDYRAVENLFRSLADQELDFVVNSVGVGFYAPLGADYSAYWDDILTTNVLGLIHILSAMLRLAPRCNQFVQIGSLAAYRPSPTPGNAVYAASKAAALPLLEHYRACVTERGLTTRVTLVSPGFIRDTGFGSRFFVSRPEASVDLFANVPALTPTAVADAVVNVLESDRTIQIRDLVIESWRSPGLIPPERDRAEGQVAVDLGE